MREQELVNLCIHWLTLKGHFVWRNNSGVTRSSYTNKIGQVKERMWRAGVRGGSDILGVTKDGKFLAVECKIGDNKATPIQQEFIRQVRQRGGIAVIVYTLDELMKVGELC